MVTTGDWFSWSFEKVLKPPKKMSVLMQRADKQVNNLNLIFIMTVILESGIVYRIGNTVGRPGSRFIAPIEIISISTGKIDATDRLNQDRPEFF